MRGRAGFRPATQQCPPFGTRTIQSSLQLVAPLFTTRWVAEIPVERQQLAAFRTQDRYSTKSEGAAVVAALPSLPPRILAGPER
jgi:hypothetical protein